MAITVVAVMQIITGKSNCIYIYIYLFIYILVDGANLSEKYESQMGLLFQIYEHLYKMLQTTNQIWLFQSVAVMQIISQQSITKSATFKSKVLELTWGFPKIVLPKRLYGF